eukprot:TRINITY_DN39428_c0_g1_i1.p1 TRINITY_DN39428_c0_g1~~TRINITY_DN39428_c0_g1_i1.p1  ORF type:complete len:533 (+),score=120.11 TRINITY_DN39428_c0_g1_i1:137-1735(+)
MTDFGEVADVCATSVITDRFTGFVRPPPPDVPPPPPPPGLVGRNVLYDTGPPGLELLLTGGDGVTSVTDAAPSVIGSDKNVRISAKAFNCGIASPPAPSRWWHELTEDDPITMEPLRNLEVPPFELASGIAGTGARHFFDAVALASYVTRRAVFENPLTREPLSRDECIHLDEHIRLHVPKCRDFRVADALDLQRSIKVKSSHSSQTEHRTATVALRREATAALHGLFRFSGHNDQAAQAVQGIGGGWTVVDDDLHREAQAEITRAADARAAEAARRPGGAPPDVTSSRAFPQLTTEASSVTVNTLHFGDDGFAQVARAAAEVAAEQSKLAEDEAWARREAVKEARAHAEAARQANAAAFAEEARKQQEARAQAALADAKRKELTQRKEEAEWRASERATALADAANAKRWEAERAAAELKLIDDLRAKEAMVVAAEEAARVEAAAKEERRKEKEQEKKRRQKEKQKLKKQEERAERAQQEERKAVERAKLTATVRCAQCDDGIINGKTPFEVMGRTFCTTTCVSAFRAAKK